MVFESLANLCYSLAMSIYSIYSTLFSQESEVSLSPWSRIVPSSGMHFEEFAISMEEYGKNTWNIMMLNCQRVAETQRSSFP